MKQALQFKLSQHLALTPQLQQSIRLLQLSTQELELEVDLALAENPLLERDEEGLDTPDPGEISTADPANAPPENAAQPEPGEPSDFASQSSPAEVSSSSAAVDDAPRTELGEPDDWGGDNAPAEVAEWSLDDSVGSGPSSDAVSSKGDGDDLELGERNAGGVTLQCHLHEQLIGRRCCQRDRGLAELIIESLDDNGFLLDSFDELARLIPVDPIAADDAPEDSLTLADELATALCLIQSFHPPGVAARNVSECLVLQLRTLPLTGRTRLAREICLGHLEMLAKRDYKRLAKLLEVDEADIRTAQTLIATLTPRPAAAFASERVREVVPDVIVRRSARGFTAALNPDVMPKLRLNQLYANIIKQRGNSSAAGLQTHLQEARWFIKNIQQRFDTILRVSQAIVERQRNFFTLGAAGMRPLVLKEIADTLGLHESTISRVTSSKYMLTPHGTFELKYFFTSGVATDTGGSASSTAVKSLIRDLIATEPTTKPLSDNDLAELLAGRGIVIARRTVAKYREALRIAPAQLRKVA